jgi:peptide/nickel transport system permease protein
MHWRFLIRRFAHAIVLLTAISLFSFALMQLERGDFFDQLRMNPRVSAETVEGMRSQYGLDRSFAVRYWRWLRSAFRGQLGISLAYNRPVETLLLPRARNTILLTGTSTALAWLLAIPLGVWGATKRAKSALRASGVATSALLTIPDLLLYLGLLLVAVRTGWFPSGGMTSLGMEGQPFLQRAKDVAWHLLLPSFGLALVALPILARHVRSALIEAWNAPFLQAARGHGIPRVRLLFRFALPVAANPLIALFGFSVATMLSSSLLVEVILSWPGLGPLLVEATLAKDVYVVVGTVMVSAIFLIAGNLLADVLLFATDPRIRVE